MAILVVQMIEISNMKAIWLNFKKLSNWHLSVEFYVVSGKKLPLINTYKSKYDNFYKSSLSSSLLYPRGVGITRVAGPCRQL